MSVRRLHPREGRAKNWRAVFRLLCLAGLGVLPAIATAQGLQADLRDLKVAYLYNFAQFAEWPREAWVPGSTDFLICSTTREGVGAGIAALQARRLRGSAVVVAYPRSSDEARHCHLLYADQALPWLRELASQPVLIVGNAPGGLSLPLSFELRGDRLRWNVNLAATRQSGLRMSSKLIELALNVSEGTGTLP